MPTIRDDYNKYKLLDIEVSPKALASVPAGADGQIAVVTDQAGRHLYVRESGTLVPAIEAAQTSSDVMALLSTQSSITMVVDYDNGESPPAGTIITSQDDYDNLGLTNGLKYIQDALDMLPLYIEHQVKINLTDGTHYAKPGTGGDFSMTLNVPSFLSRSYKFYFDQGPLYTPGIWISGSVTVEEESISGTLAAYSFTRSTGTWTEDSLVGKRILITSGASAGTEFLICKNSATVAELCSRATSVGSCVANVIGLGAALISNDGDTSTWLGVQMSNLVASNVPLVLFDHVSLGTISDRLMTSTLSSSFAGFNSCDIFVDGNLNFAYASFSSSVNVKSYFDCGVGSSISSVCLGYNGFSGCLFLSSATTGTSLFSSYDHAAHTVATFSDCVFRAMGSFSGYLLQVSDNIQTLLSVNTRLLGNNLCKGILLSQAFGYGSPKISLITSSGYSPSIANCTIAVEARGCVSPITVSSQFDASLSTGNGVGFKLSQGSDLHVKNLSAIAATTEVEIDGEAIPYSEFANVGDCVIGIKGSKLTYSEF